MKDALEIPGWKPTGEYRVPKKGEFSIMKPIRPSQSDGSHGPKDYRIIMEPTN